MRVLSVSGIALIGMLSVVGAGTASIAPRNLSNLEGHRSSLRAILTMKDGSARPVTLDGVGCLQAMCSGVKAREQDNSIWLDGLASVRGISQTAGAVRATFRFRDGAERHGAIVAANRVLYVHRPLGFTEKIDLGTVNRIDFE